RPLFLPLPFLCVLCAFSVSLWLATSALAAAQPITLIRPPFGGHPAAPVSFYKEILPLLRSDCAACHGDKSPSNGFVVTSYAGLMKGGKGGREIIAGKSGDSRLTKYLLGILQPKMPIGGSLKPAEIDRIRRWIDAGARADEPLS